MKIYELKECIDNWLKETGNNISDRFWNLEIADFAYICILSLLFIVLAIVYFIKNNKEEHSDF
jgi:hypothetical protein